jgi:toxin YoeB
MIVTKVIWEEKAKADYDFWVNNDANKVDKIKNLILSCKTHPFKGIGKPEPLKGNLSGYWSRRIDKEHRFVYLFSDGTLTIAQCRYHY